MDNDISTTFWTWLIGYIVLKERVTLPNFGVFSLQYKNNYYIHFKATGSFKKALRLNQISELGEVLYFTGDRHPATSVKKWGPIIKGTKDLSNLSLHRRLIWDFAQETRLTLEDSANICSTEINRMTTELLKNNTVSLLPEWHMRRHIKSKKQQKDNESTSIYSHQITSTVDSDKISVHFVRYNIK